MKSAMKWIVLFALQVLCFTTVVIGRGTWNASGNYEYFVSPLKVYKSYNDSLEFCKNNSGELALIKSADIQNFLQTLVTDAGGLFLFDYSRAFYIGLRDPTKTNTFVWDDGEPLNYTNWATSETSNSGRYCVEAVRLSYHAETVWYKVGCNAQFGKGIFCQRLIGWHWSGWSDWTNCSCSRVQERSRACTYSNRSGPATCLKNITRAFEPRDCNSTKVCTTTESFQTTAHVTSEPTTRLTTEVPVTIPTVHLILSIIIVILVLGILGEIGFYFCKRQENSQRSHDVQLEELPPNAASPDNQENRVYEELAI